MSVSDPVVVSFSESMAPASVSVTLRDPSNAVVPGALSYAAATKTAVLVPSCTVGVGDDVFGVGDGTDLATNALVGSPVSWSYTTGGLGACPCSIFSVASTPAGTDPDASPLELGVKFRADVDGYVKGVRFYKAAGNTGTHTGSLWSSSGQQLATATFSGETASGWQQVVFSEPVAVTANTTYVASYFAPNGNYSYTGGQFATAGVDNAPLHALASGVDGLNGVFHSGSSAFPGEFFGATNYWVDVSFDTDSTVLETPQTITFPDLTGRNYGDAPVTVSATEAVREAR